MSTIPIADSTTIDQPNEIAETETTKNSSPKSVASGTKRHKVYSSPAQNSETNELPVINESTFVTPGIFRRKLSKKRPPTGEEEDKKSKEGRNGGKMGKENLKSQQFRWTIDQMAVLRPAQFDDSELSLPPEDWDPNTEHNRTQPLAVDQFWSRNKHIVPSPDVLKATSKGAGQQQPKSSTIGESSTSPPTYQPITFCSPNFPGGVDYNCSSTTSRSDPSSIFSSMHVTPSSPAFESTRRGMDFGENKQLTTTLDANSAEFEQIERSLSLGIDADEILADLGDESGGFVRRQSMETSKSDKEEGTAGGLTGNSSGLGTSTSSATPAPPFYIETSPIKPV